MKERYVWLISAGHAFTDLSQGALPALLPFLIVAHDLSYAAAAGLVFAANFLSSILQPLFGWVSDKYSWHWLMPAGVLLSGGAMALIGVLDSYWWIFFAVALSGVGVSAFHPEAARLANYAAGERKGRGIGIFSVGGNVGFALGPVIATASVLTFGLPGTLVMAVLGVLMALGLWREQGTFRMLAALPAQHGAENEELRDDWPSFGKLTLGIFARAVMFFGLNTFLPLYFLHVLGESEALSSATLTIFFTAGAVATLVGGQMGDRYGHLKIIRWGFLGFVPILFIFLQMTSTPLALAMLVPVGLFLFAPYSLMVLLGQEYLPRQIGFAAGVTLGLGTTIGGIIVPLLGMLADRYGIMPAMYVIAAVGVMAALVVRWLPDPAARQRILRARKSDARRGEWYNEEKTLRRKELL